VRQVELMRGEDMTPPEIVQLIVWSKECGAFILIFETDIWF
jgi:hypothetical protein